jgi:protein associated with RNAse G/E
MKTLTVIKQDYRGIEIWRYEGNLIARSPNKIVIEAFFDREDTPVDGVTLQRGDRFIETYFSERWYNIYEIQEQMSGVVKILYCNVGYPAVISENSIAYRDLALDLLIYPDGKQKVLDEHEFEALPISQEVQIAARQALLELKEKFST